MKGLSITGLLILMLGSVVAVQAQDSEEIRQWASKALATSQYSENQGWQASQATGEPDTEKCDDLPTAWASATDTGFDTLTVFFRKPVYPTQINIHQSYNPGAIVNVGVLPADGRDVIILQNSADTETEVCPGVFTIDLSPDTDDLPPINGITITVDQTITGNWNEIDAVELVGLLPAESDSVSPPVQPTDVLEIKGSDDVLASEVEYIQPGYAINCDTTFGDASFVNGTQFLMHLPNGNRFTFTAVGIGNFDPVIAILDPSSYGTCSDDNGAAASYGARLPTTGDVNPANSSAQLVIDVQHFESSVPYTVVVGSRDNQPGEFLLFIEGGFSERSDGIGDIYSMNISPGMIASGVHPTAYMFGVVQAFDAYIYLVDGESNALIDTESKNYIACDNAGGECYGDSSNLVGSAISRSDGRALGGGSMDAMLSLPVAPGDEDFWLNYVMLGNRTYGDYVVVFHAGVADPNE